MIEQQTEQLKDLNEKNGTLSSQLESQTELNKQLNEHKNQIESFKQERAKLLEELEKKTLPPIQTKDNESQTDDHQHEKLVQMNNKLKRALQTFKDKIHRVVNERPDLFDGIGEETSERLDHLISTVENQATKVNKLQAVLDQADEKYQGQIKNLQR
jgi:methyl-accepting chemotaxis protein